VQEDMPATDAPARISDTAAIAPRALPVSLQSLQAVPDCYGSFPMKPFDIG